VINIIIIFMDYAMSCLFHPYVQHVGPPILILSALNLVVFLGCMVIKSLVQIWRLAVCERFLYLLRPAKMLVSDYKLNYIVYKCIITDLINALPGNSSVNQVQHATIEEAVFSVSAVTSQNSG
jgi:hypothetical protein